MRANYCKTYLTKLSKIINFIYNMNTIYSNKYGFLNVSNKFLIIFNFKI